MAFSTEWEQVYKNQQHLSLWPWTDLVSYFMRYVKPNLKNERPKILELGFGAGANIPFYKSLEADFYGIDGSVSIVDKIKEIYKEYKDNLFCGDFTKSFPFEEKFDVIVDRGSLTHNYTKDIENTIETIKKSLVKNGYFIGIDWFSKSHSEFNSKGILKDANTKILTEGYFTGLGTIHFSDEQHIRELFKDFQIIKMEHKVHTDYTKDEDKTDRDIFAGGGNKVFASWNFIAKLT